MTITRRKQIATWVMLMSMSAFDSTPAVAQFQSQQEIARLPAAPADQRIPYGDDRMQFGDLRSPPATDRIQSPL